MFFTEYPWLVVILFSAVVEHCNITLEGNLQKVLSHPQPPSLLLSFTYVYKKVKKIFHLLKRTAEFMPIMVIITNNSTTIGISSHHKLFKQGSIISLGVHKMLKSKTTKLLCVNQPDADEITFHFRENTKQSYNLLNVALM